MANESRRIEALKEIGRVLVPNGKAMVTSWAMKQNVEGNTSNYVKDAEGDIAKNSVNSQQLPIHKPRTEFESADILVPFKGRSDGTSDDIETVHRFYHVFQERYIFLIDENFCVEFIFYFS